MGMSILNSFRNKAFLSLDSIPWSRSTVLIYLVVLLILYLVLSSVFATSSNAKGSIPVVRFTDNAGWLQQQLDLIKVISRGAELVFKGYETYPGRFFQLKFPANAGVIVVDNDHIKEVTRAREEQLSFNAVLGRLMGFESMMKTTLYNNYHSDILRNQVTQSIQMKMPELVDELEDALRDEFDPHVSQDYGSLVLYDQIARVVARVTHRAFIGRDPEYLDATIRHASAVQDASKAFMFIPVPLRRLVGKLFFKDLDRGERVAYKFLGPIIEERRKKMKEDGEFNQKPADFLQWLMDAAPGKESRTDYLTSRVLLTNTGAIHTTTMAFLQALYSMAAHPECIQPLREEVETLVAREGWQKTTITKLRKLDSFLKESLRLNPLSIVGVVRKVMKETTFSNGITLNPGTMVGCPVLPIHLDHNIYKNAEVFDPFRFYNEDEKDVENLRNYSASTSSTFLTFGHGIHACPGRFLAVNEIKLMLAFVLLRYDLRTKRGERPADKHYEMRLSPNLTAEILVRKRRID